MAKYIITTVSTFVHKYAIEAETEEQAKGEWEFLNGGGYQDTYSDCCEIKQTHIAENIAEIREATDEDIIKEADEYMRGFVLNNVRVVKHD